MLIPIATFLSISLAIFVIALLFLRIGKTSGQSMLSSSSRRPLVFGILTKPLAGVFPTGAATREKLEQLLRHAGHYHRFALAEYLALRNAMVLGWTALVVTFIAAGTEPGDGLIQPTIIIGSRSRPNSKALWQRSLYPAFSKSPVHLDSAFCPCSAET